MFGFSTKAIANPRWMPADLKELEDVSFMTMHFSPHHTSPYQSTSRGKPMNIRCGFFLSKCKQEFDETLKLYDSILPAIKAMHQGQLSESYNPTIHHFFLSAFFQLWIVMLRRQHQFWSFTRQPQSRSSPSSAMPCPSTVQARNILSVSICSLDRVFYLFKKRKVSADLKKVNALKLVFFCIQNRQSV
jgi:hypothetical protein